MDNILSFHFFHSLQFNAASSQDVMASSSSRHTLTYKMDKINELSRETNLNARDS